LNRPQKKYLGAKTPKYFGSSKIHQTCLCQSLPGTKDTPCAKRHQDISLTPAGTQFHTSDENTTFPVVHKKFLGTRHQQNTKIFWQQ
jgi:hypothetical protein